MRCWLDSGALAFIKDESQRQAPKETGGVLLGYCADNDVVVRLATGPGRRAKHRFSSYRPDTLFDRAEIARIYDETNGVITYLGDWHSHPKGGSQLSEDDVITLANISNFTPARTTAPMMLLSVKNGSSWAPAVWRIDRVTKTGYDYLLTPLEILLFSSDS